MLVCMYKLYGLLLWLPYFKALKVASQLNAGMSRDKCGAAAAAGVMASIAALQPQGVKVGNWACLVNTVWLRGVYLGYLRNNILPCSVNNCIC